jgi:hypothetical protein
MLCVCGHECRIALEMGAETHVGFHRKCPLLLFDFNHNWNVSTNFNKSASIKLNESPFCDTLGQTEGQDADRCCDASGRILLQRFWGHAVA